MCYGMGRLTLPLAALCVPFDLSHGSNSKRPPPLPKATQTFISFHQRSTALIWHTHASPTAPQGHLSSCNLELSTVFAPQPPPVCTVHGWMHGFPGVPLPCHPTHCCTAKPGCGRNDACMGAAKLHNPPPLSSSLASRMPSSPSSMKSLSSLSYRSSSIAPESSSWAPWTLTA